MSCHRFMKCPRWEYARKGGRVRKKFSCPSCPADAHGGALCHRGSPSYNGTGSFLVDYRTLAQPELASRLADYLYGLREKLGEESFPRRAEQYLDDWAADSRGWLRKYYPPGNDEAHYDLTPPTERAIDWLAGFNQRQFVGAESRLMTVFALLREIAQGTEVDP